MGLFTDIYNTVAKFFRQQDEIDASKSVATNRLKLVLMQDRTNLTPRILEQMRGELVDLLSKYLEMDKELLELNFEQEGEQVALMLSIPVIRAKDEEEIEEALKSANAEKEDIISESSEDADIEDEAISEEEQDSDASEETGDMEEVTEEILEQDSDNIEENNTRKTKRKQTKQMSNPQDLETDSEKRQQDESVETEVVTD